MNRKQTMLKHAEKMAVAALRITVISMILLCGRGTVMTVQAVNEMQIQDDIVDEVWQIPETVSGEVTQEQIENEEAVAQAEIESIEAAQAQTENMEEVLQEQTEDAEEAPQEEIVQEPVENAEETDQEQTPITVDPMTVTMVGDSVLLGASPSIQEMLPGCVINAKVGRQMIEGYAVLDSLEQQNALRQTVVVELGTNGPFSVAKGQELIDRLGSGRTIYWVTVYGADLSWQGESNATIRTLAANNENVHIIDWEQAVAGHAEWLCADGIHLSAEGRRAYAGIVFEGLLC